MSSIDYKKLLSVFKTSYKKKERIEKYKELINENIREQSNSKDISYIQLTALRILEIDNEVTAEEKIDILISIDRKHLIEMMACIRYRDPLKDSFSSVYIRILQNYLRDKKAAIDKIENLLLDKGTNLMLYLQGDQEKSSYIDFFIDLYERYNTEFIKKGKVSFIVLLFDYWFKCYMPEKEDAINHLKIKFYTDLYSINANENFIDYIFRSYKADCTLTWVCAFPQFLSSQSFSIKKNKGFLEKNLLIKRNFMLINTTYSFDNLKRLFLKDMYENLPGANIFFSGNILLYISVMKIVFLRFKNTADCVAACRFVLDLLCADYYLRPAVKGKIFTMTENYEIDEYYSLFSLVLNELFLKNEHKILSDFFENNLVFLHESLRNPSACMRVYGLKTHPFYCFITNDAINFPSKENSVLAFEDAKQDMMVAPRSNLEELDHEKSMLDQCVFIEEIGSSENMVAAYIEKFFTQEKMMKNLFNNVSAFSSYISILTRLQFWFATLSPANINSAKESLLNFFIGAMRIIFMNYNNFGEGAHNEAIFKMYENLTSIFSVFMVQFLPEHVSADGFRKVESLMEVYRPQKLANDPHLTFVYNQVLIRRSPDLSPGMRPRAVALIA